MTLRRWIGGFGAAFTAGGIALAVGLRAPGALGLLVPGVLMLGGACFERIAYRRLDAEPPPGPDWARTGERFRDPLTRAPIEVFHNRRTGERRYIRRAQDVRAPAGN